MAILRVALAVLLLVSVCSAVNSTVNATAASATAVHMSASVAVTTPEPSTAAPTSGVAEFAPAAFVLAMSAVFAAVARL